MQFLYLHMRDCETHIQGWKYVILNVLEVAPKPQELGKAAICHMCNKFDIYLVFNIIFTRLQTNQEITDKSRDCRQIRGDFITLYGILHGELQVSF